MWCLFSLVSWCFAQPSTCLVLADDIPHIEDTLICLSTALHRTPKISSEQETLAIMNCFLRSHNKPVIENRTGLNHFQMLQEMDWERFVAKIRGILDHTQKLQQAHRVTEDLRSFCEKLGSEIQRQSLLELRMDFYSSFFIKWVFLFVFGLIDLLIGLSYLLIICYVSPLKKRNTLICIILSALIFRWQFLQSAVSFVFKSSLLSIMN